MKRLSVRMDDGLLESLALVAEVRGQSLNRTVVEMLEEGVASATDDARFHEAARERIERLQALTGGG